jgi:diguanylate cyclase (GGDEF)-like protein
VSLTDELLHFRSWIVFGFVILILAGIGLAWAIGGRISQTISGLRVPALPLGLGKLVIVPSLRLKEADETRHALIRATTMLLEAQQKALHDPLTGLPNRELFAEVANQRLAVCRKEGTTLAVLYLDVDTFKSVNDNYGHAVGDALLCAVATRLRHAIRRADLAARVGGDEFTVLLVGIRLGVAAKVAGRLGDLLSHPYPLGPLTLHTSVSIGVSEYPDSGASIPVLLASADEAMYKAKAAGRRRAAVAGAT